MRKTTTAVFTTTRRRRSRCSSAKRNSPAKSFWRRRPTASRGRLNRTAASRCELARTKSFGYSSFNLRALIDLASIGQNLGIDLWHYRGPNGGSIYRALAFMAPYADPAKKWPFQQIHGYNHDSLAELVASRRAAFQSANESGGGSEVFSAERTGRQPLPLVV